MPKSRGFDTQLPGYRQKGKVTNDVLIGKVAEMLCKYVTEEWAPVAQQRIIAESDMVTRQLTGLGPDPYESSPKTFLSLLLSECCSCIIATLGTASSNWAGSINIEGPSIYNSNSILTAAKELLGFEKKVSAQIPELLRQIHKFVKPAVGDAFSQPTSAYGGMIALSMSLAAMKPTRFANFRNALETTVGLVLSELTEAAIKRWTQQMPIFMALAMERNTSFSFVVKMLGCKEVFIPFEEQLKDTPKLLGRILEQHKLDALLQEDEFTRKKRAELNNEKAVFTATLKELQRITSAK